MAALAIVWNAKLTPEARSALYGVIEQTRKTYDEYERCKDDLRTSEIQVQMLQCVSPAASVSQSGNTP